MRIGYWKRTLVLKSRFTKYKSFLRLGTRATFSKARQRGRWKSPSFWTALWKHETEGSRERERETSTHTQLPFRVSWNGSRYVSRRNTQHIRRSGGSRLRLETASDLCAESLSLESSRFDLSRGVSAKAAGHAQRSSKAAGRGPPKETRCSATLSNIQSGMPRGPAFFSSKERERERERGRERESIWVQTRSDAPRAIPVHPLRKRWCVRATSRARSGPERLRRLSRLSPFFQNIQH